MDTGECCFLGSHVLQKFLFIDSSEFDLCLLKFVKERKIFMVLFNGI